MIQVIDLECIFRIIEYFHKIKLIVKKSCVLSVRLKFTRKIES